jgi:secreted trypsin-like serine protease
LLVSGISTFILLQGTFSAQNSSALVRGRQESGYDFVGYIISNKNKICAATLITEDKILTAAHCLSKSAGDSFYFGRGAFNTNIDKLNRVLLVQFDKSYDLDRELGPDIAIAKLLNKESVSALPSFRPSSINCNASIVAYGSGVSEKVANLDLFQKKSGEGCVKSISDTFVIEFNPEVGMCFGDSGGPIFSSKGSREIIGILSGGFIDPQLDTLKCDPANTGIAVNTYSYQDFIKSSLQETSISSNYRVFSERQFEFNIGDIVLTNQEYTNTDNSNSNLTNYALLIFYAIVVGSVITLIVIALKD